MVVRVGEGCLGGRRVRGRWEDGVVGVRVFECEWLRGCLVFVSGERK